MPISMDERAHYVTQSSCYGTVFLGRLTSRRIAHYQKLGYYGPQGLLTESKKKAKKKQMPRRTTLNELRKLYVF